MPKKKTITIWACSICGEEWESRAEAFRCERQGIFAPAVHMGQMVDVRYPNGDSYEGMVCHIASEFFTSPFLHEGPLSYMVCLENGNVRSVDIELVWSKHTSRAVRQPPNVGSWDLFWRKFKRDNRETRKLVQHYLRLHGAVFTLKDGKLKFRRDTEETTRKK